MSTLKMTKTSSSGKAKPRPINVTHGARAENEMAKMEKEAKASSARGDPQVKHQPVLSNVEQWADSIQRRISEAIQIHGRCALPFSGGFESCLLLHLAEPWKDQIVVVTLDTGAVFSHIENFLNRVLGGWNRKVVRTDIGTYLKNQALPSHIFSLAEKLRSPLDLSDIRTVGGRRVISSFDCCCRNRGFPGHHAVKDLNIRAVFSDQIGGDRNAAPKTLDGVATIAPLSAHVRAEIEEMIGAFGIVVPDHYPHFDAPHGCSICPAALTPLRQVWMAKLYPAELTVAGTFQAEEAEAVRAAIENEDAATAKVFHLKKMEPV